MLYLTVKKEINIILLSAAPPDGGAVRKLRLIKGLFRRTIK